jgi:hypothetical protein
MRQLSRSAVRLDNLAKMIRDRLQLRAGCSNRGGYRLAVLLPVGRDVEADPRRVIRPHFRRHIERFESQELQDRVFLEGDLGCQGHGGYPTEHRQNHCVESARHDDPTGTVKARQLARTEIVADEEPMIQVQASEELEADRPIFIGLDHDDDLGDHRRLDESPRDLGEERHMGAGSLVRADRAISGRRLRCQGPG